MEVYNKIIEPLELRKKAISNNKVNLVSVPNYVSGRYCLRHIEFL